MEGESGVSDGGVAQTLINQQTHHLTEHVASKERVEEAGVDPDGLPGPALELEGRLAVLSLACMVDVDGRA